MRSTVSICSFFVKQKYKYTHFPSRCLYKTLPKFSYMTKPHIPNLQQTVANTILIINISNNNNINKF